MHSRLSSAILEAFRNSVIDDVKAASRQAIREEMNHSNLDVLRNYIVDDIKAALPTLIRKEMEVIFASFGFIPKPAPRKIDGPPSRPLHLQFTGNLEPVVYTDANIGQNLGAQLLNADGQLVTTGPESSVKLEVVALEGDFDKDDWTEEEFDKRIAIARKGKKPLLVGDLNAYLMGGICKLGTIKFTDNSSCTRSGNFRLGVRVCEEEFGQGSICEAKTQAFAVKEARGLANRKRYPPLLDDEVWRLENIRRNGEIHRRLMNNRISTVGEFCRSLHSQPCLLKRVLGMNIKRFDATIKHALQSEGCSIRTQGAIGCSSMHQVTNSLGSIPSADQIPDFAHVHGDNCCQMVSLDSNGIEHCHWANDRAQFADMNHNLRTQEVVEGQLDNMDYSVSSIQEVSQGQMLCKSGSRWRKVRIFFLCAFLLKSAKIHLLLHRDEITSMSESLSPTYREDIHGPAMMEEMWSPAMLWEDIHGPGC